MTNTPTPEAIVKAALERAADTLRFNCQGDCDWPDLARYIRTLASDPAEVAQIIQNAGGQTDPYLYAVGYDVGFEDGFKEAQGKLTKALGFVEFLDENYRHAFGDTARAKIRELYAELKGESDD